MPHQCTGCDRTFDDGSKEMLSGCPDCGGNKFQFKPERETDRTVTRETDRTVTTDATTAGTTGDTDADEDRRSTDDSDENTAQATARSDVVDPDELPDKSDASVPTDSSTAEPSGGTPAATDASSESAADSTANRSHDTQPDISDLREELNDQFESIKIVNPGQYELNLMELYDRQEQIISLQEDGRYVIEMPETLPGDG